VRKQAGLDELPTFSQEEVVAEQDWVQLTQSQFEPIRISGRLWIVPSWHAPPTRRRSFSSLIPGMAFGTGSHPTTRLCLEWLERRVVAGMSVLDYGCGSGILAIAAARLGATRGGRGRYRPAGRDLGPQQCREQWRQRRFQDSAGALNGQFDIVVANILANPLKVLAPAISAHVRAGGRLALSGILCEQTDDLIAAYAPYLPLAVADCATAGSAWRASRTEP
jgi:ribosomal protein L11 methyltransferase